MKRMSAIAAAVAVAGCADNVAEPLVPSDDQVARLEQLLAQHPCVGDINEWERNYRFGHHSQRFWPGTFKPEFDIIEFRYRHTGPIVIKAARNVVAVGMDTEWPDIPEVRALTGKFNIKTGSLNMRRCTPDARQAQRQSSGAQSPLRP